MGTESIIYPDGWVYKDGTLVGGTFEFKEPGNGIIKPSPGP